MNQPSLTTPDAELIGLSNINVVLGRNGAGKSRFLRTLENNLAPNPAFQVRYISPERAGVFRRDGGVLNAMEQNKDWLRSVRGKNQAENFKATSANLLRELELAYLRRLESTTNLRNDPDRNFRLDRLDKINRLLANIAIFQEGSDLVFRTSSGDIITPDQISSGESEAVALAVEVMYFFETIDSSRFNVLLLDEPDVHLHPDLQARLARFITAEIDALPGEMRSSVAVCIATHSTPLVCALALSEYTTIGTKHFAQSRVQQVTSAEVLRKAAPFFGHPLSMALSLDTLLIVEGEDDERVWQQAARTSHGRIGLFPIVAGSVNKQTELETACAPLLQALYDSPLAFSVRDGDKIVAPLESIGPVVRFRLQCYAMENALLTDECLAVLGMPWPEFQTALTHWLQLNPSHKDESVIKQLQSSQERLRYTKIKAIRQLICSIAGKLRPWEVVVGQALGELDVSTASTESTSLLSFIGVDACKALLVARTL